MYQVSGLMRARAYQVYQASRFLLNQALGFTLGH